MRHSAASIRAAAILAAAFAWLCMAHPAPAQGLPPVWVSVDGSQPGTPASVDLDVAASSPERSVFDLVLHGFWMTPLQGADGRAYQQISVPGLPSLSQFGAPELPMFPFALGIVTGSPMIALAGADVMARSTYSGVLPWPHPIGAIPDSFPRPERFVRDESYYSSPLDFPPSPASPTGPVSRLSGELKAATGQLYPIHWNASGMLTVDWHVRYTLDHPGAPSPAQTGSPQEARSALAAMANHGVVEPWVTWNHIQHRGDFLFIYPTAYETALLPLVEQKKKRGYWVTMLRLEDVRAHVSNEPWCAPVREAIESWYASTPASGTHYGVLVGDAHQIPVCNAPRPEGYELGTQLATDDFFGDADADGIDDLGKEVYVGRLSANNAGELGDQVARILAYSETPSPLQAFDRAGLIAWNSADDNRFLLALNKVQSATYASVTPGFDLADGGLTFVHNNWIDSFAQHDGILAYNGHGSSIEWWNWSRSHESYSNASVGALTNQPVTPVVWSLACYTGRILLDDCLGETWMAQGQDGAVSFYGATEPSWIWDNGILAQRLFGAVFHYGFTTQGIAIAFAEFGTILDTSTDNPVQYLLLGDPEMQIRREPVTGGPPFQIDIPLQIIAGPLVPLDVQVLRSSGAPAAGVQVALWKPRVLATAGTPGGPPVDEILDNRYTDDAGHAHFDLTGLSPGTLHVTTFDDDAHVVSRTIDVAGSSGVGTPGSEGGIRIAAAAANGRVEFVLSRAADHDGTITIFDVSGRRAQVLTVERGARRAAWDGTGASGARVPDGLYFARFVAGASAAFAKFTLVR